MVDLKTLETETGYGKWRRVPKFILIYCKGAVDLDIEEKMFRLLPGEVITITSRQMHMINPGFRSVLPLKQGCSKNTGLKFALQPCV